MSLVRDFVAELLDTRSLGTAAKRVVLRRLARAVRASLGRAD